MIRPLHWCLKIINRSSTIDFYENKLEMKVIRHEEFSNGCQVECNGPYKNRWSKTMIGYGPEDENFLLELTYNYDIKSYEIGNDYNGIVIESTKLFDKLKSEGEILVDCLKLKDPNNYPIQIVKGNSNKVIRCELNIENFEFSLSYWCNVLGMNIIEKKSNYVDLAYKPHQALLRLIETKVKINHKTGYGRIAFAIPMKKLLELNEKVMKLTEYKFLYNKIELGTPGKQTVTVIILLDPDGYEICFVNNEDYTVLSALDPNAREELARELIKENKNK